MRHAYWAMLFGALLLLGGLAAAETDRAALPSKIEKANDEEAVHRIESLAKTVAGLEWTEKHEKLAEDVGRELYDSLGEVDEDWDARGAVIDALGAVGGRYARRALPRIAFREAREGPERRMRVRALHAAGRLLEPRYLDSFEDAARELETDVAVAAYEALAAYGKADARIRRRVADLLMGRLRAEQPSYGGQSDKNISDAAYARWRKVQRPIVDALQAVCRQHTISHPGAWRQWWDENEDNPEAWRDENQ